jgi:hypothetical protein
MLCHSVRDVISPQPDLQIGTGSPDRFPDLKRALIGGVCRSWQWAPLAQRHIKEGPAGAREPTFTVPAAPPQTLTLRPIKEALKRGDWHHLASAPTTDGLRPRPNTGDRRPRPNTDDLYTDRRHVFFLIASRYTLVIPRL